MDLSGVESFILAIKALRAPGTGCPWDLAQSHESLMKYFVEELHEFMEAMQEHGPHDPKTWEELGDVVLQVLLHSELASEKGITDFNQVCAAAAAKTRLRHPHVFDPSFARFKTPEEVSKAWEQIKAYAKSRSRSAPKPVFAQAPTAPLLKAASDSMSPRADQVNTVPRTLPSLTRAARVGEKAAAFRFDWPEASQVLDKILEESEELVADQEDPIKAQEELGDLLFAASQYARKRGWDPEQVLSKATDKFCRRFREMEARIARQGLDYDSLSLEKLEEQWVGVKKGKGS